MERDIIKMRSGFSDGISTHTLTWSVTGDSYRIPVPSEDFNSHAHVERDKQWFAFLLGMGISTHTLTWSVTRLGLLIPWHYSISTHTLTWSVTRLSAQAQRAL